MMLTHSLVVCAPKRVSVLNKLPQPQHCTNRNRSFRDSAVNAVISSARDLTSSSDRPEKLPVMSLISACIEVEAQVQRFELVAGRSAMIGFLLAVFVELFTDEGVFHVSSDVLSLFGSLSIVCLIGAVILAATSKRRLGAPFKEAVITSLTAAKRSAASVTQSPVDKAVDTLCDIVPGIYSLYTIMTDDEYI